MGRVLKDVGRQGVSCVTHLQIVGWGFPVSRNSDLSKG